MIYQIILSLSVRVLKYKKDFISPDFLLFSLFYVVFNEKYFTAIDSDHYFPFPNAYQIHSPPHPPNSTPSFSLFRRKMCKKEKIRKNTKHTHTKPPIKTQNRNHDVQVKDQNFSFSACCPVVGLFVSSHLL